MTSKQVGHSEEYFGDYRNDWWNQDFLELMAKRWNLSNIKNVLDVGCGLGHWSRELFRLLPSGALIRGIDSDEKWVKESMEWMRQTKYGSRFTSAYGLADEIPYENDTFDLVTCQTVLIHVKDISKVLSEFLRVLKPGGLFIAAEPNNIASYLVKSSISAKSSIEERVAEIKFALMCEDGKIALGQGDSSAGDLIPGIASVVGFEDIQVYLSDKASPLYPPYDSQEQKNLISQYRTTSDDESGLSVREDLRRQFVAGGGVEKDFDQAYKEDGADFLNSIDNQSYHSAGGGIMYLISGRK